MHFRNLCQVSCLIALCFFFVPAAAQNTSIQTADTAKKSSGHGSQPKDSIVVISDPAVVITRQVEQFNQGAIFNPLDQLSGKVAGVTVTHPGGDPNQAASVSIRGQSSIFGNLSPLFVVDGVILDDAVEFQNIPPEDIASYTILKDASAAAFYGARAANGVIIVTTKKGKAGHPVISYSGLVGSSVQSKYYDLLTPAEFRAAVGNQNGGFTDKGASTDWQKAINRRAWQQRNSLSVSGGSDNFNYLGGVDYQDQQGIILNSGKKELGLRFSGELKTLADKLDIKAGVQNVNTNRQFDDYDAFSYVFNAPPTSPVKNADGSYYAFSDFNLANPAEHLNEEDLGGKEHLTLLHASVDYSIIHDLKIGIFGSANLNRTQSDGYIPSFPLEGNQSESSHSDEHAHLYNGNIHLDYNKTFGI
ncbi:MAG TPA: TonB-dependent receptor plug domain-containing protein, partial [Mucilaginibacter sp.]|nr:TonB-dependent receptor plug domain-containing protein [Mucilaginibacter sp.]